MLRVIMKTKKSRSSSSPVEMLENRQLLSGADDLIEGAAGNDLFLLQWESGNVAVYRNSIQAENLVYTKSASLVSSLTFNLGNGSNAVNIALDAPALGSTLRLNIICGAADAFNYINFTHPLASTQLSIQPGGVSFGSIEVNPVNITTYGFISNADTAIQLDSLSLGVPLKLAKGDNQAFRLNSLSIAGAGSLDLNGRSLILDNVSSIPSLNAWIVNGEVYTTPSLVSTFSKSTSTLAIVNNTRLHKAAYLGQPLGPTFSQTLIRQALKGDGNMNGVVDFEDYLPVYANMGRHSCEWPSGDYNHDGLVSPADLAVIQKAQSDIVYIPDPQLQSAIRGALNIPTGDITQSDMLNLTVLPAISLGISDLSGLEFAKNLQQLSLYDNHISNLTPIAGLTGLTDLYLGKNQISDLSPLSSLTQLTTLLIENNQVVDLSPLENLKQLSFLDLSGNQVSNVSPVGALPQLFALFLQSNQITTISSLSGLSSIGILDISDNHVSDLEPLKNRVSLQMLMADRNHITNLAPLSNLVQLGSLTVSNNQIVDIGAVSTLTNLTRLDLGFNKIASIASISGLHKLEDLKLNNNQVALASPLMSATALIAVDLSNNLITNISGILALTHLSALNVSYNYLDVSSGSPSMVLINTLIGNGVSVNYLPQSLMLLSSHLNTSNPDLTSICLWQYQTAVGTNQSLLVSQPISRVSEIEIQNQAKPEKAKTHKAKKGKIVSARKSPSKTKLSRTLNHK